MDQLLKTLGIVLNATLMYTPPLLFAALGSCCSEKSGVINIGIEGMMTIGAFTGAAVGYFSGDPWLAFLCAGLAGMVFALIHGFACITCKADQTISGTAITSLPAALPFTFAACSLQAIRKRTQCPISSPAYSTAFLNGATPTLAANGAKRLQRTAFSTTCSTHTLLRI